MDNKQEKSRIKMDTHKSVAKILPNMITSVALCFGLTSIYFAFLKKWEIAIACTLIAAALDGIDGRVARLLKSSSQFGAELDSLADLVNFGVSPAILIYMHSLHQNGRSGWACCVFYSICMALRLARFNVHNVNYKSKSDLYSVGIPAPGGAVILLSPIIFEFVFEGRYIPSWVFAVNTIFTATLLISRIPTFVFKKMPVRHSQVLLLLVSIVATIVSLFAAPWQSILLLTAIYVISIPISCSTFFRQSKANFKEEVFPAILNDFLNRFMHK